MNSQQKPRYSLADLLAECDSYEPLPADMVAWMEMPDVGKQIWPEYAEGGPAKGEGKGAA